MATELNGLLSNHPSSSTKQKQPQQQQVTKQQQQEHVPLPPRNFGAIDASGDFFLDEAPADEGMMEDIDDGLSSSTVEALMNALSNDGMSFMDQDSNMISESSYQAPVGHDMMTFGGTVEQGFR